MELNISELNNANTMNPYETFDYKSYEKQSDVNYWEKSVKKEPQEKRKKVTFNDILSNMNLVVNNQGVLQFMGPNQEPPVEQNTYSQQYNPNNFSQPMQNQYSQNNFQQKEEPIDPSVKHSYIFNKYFKDYADPNVMKPGPRVPKTIEEYHQMLLDDKIAAIKQKQRIDQIKSKKMFFTSVPGSHSNPRNIQATKNTLRSMNFR